MDAEAEWERVPRGRMHGDGGPGPDERELMPVRQSDGHWKRQFTKKKAPNAQPPPAPTPPSTQQSASQLATAAAAEVESAAVKRARIAKLSAMVLEAPHKHIGLLGELLTQFVGSDACSPNIQRLALLSAAAVLRDIIPAYRIRLPTEKELKMQVSKEVELLREYERKLMDNYEKCLTQLRRWVSSRVEGHRTAAVRGLCALVDKAYDFNFRDDLIAALVPIANSADATLRKDACAALIQMYEADTQGEATLVAVRTVSALLKSSSFHVQPDLIGTWLSLRMDAAAAAATDAPANRRAKKRKREMDPVARELAAAAGERGNVARVQTQTLEHVFVSYARVVKRGAHSPLLPAVLRGVAKFAHQVNVELLLDLFANLRVLMSADGEEVLPTRTALHCVHALLQLLSGHGQALSVDTKDVHSKLFQLLTERALLEQPDLLATALDCVEHLCKRNRTALLAPRAASLVHRLLGLACTAPPAQAIALLCAASRLHVAVPKLSTMLEPPEGGAPMHYTAIGGGGGANLVVGAMVLMDGEADIDAPIALHSTAWQLSELRRHYHPVVSELAAKVAAQQPLAPKFAKATPLSLMNSYSFAAGAFHPAPAPPKPHRLATAHAAAMSKGEKGPVLGVVPSSSLESVRQEQTSALEAMGSCTASFDALWGGGCSPKDHEA